MVVRIAGKRMYLWRSVDHEGEVLEMLVQRRRDSRAALRLIRKLLRKQGFAPKLLVTDKLPSCFGLLLIPYRGTKSPRCEVAGGSHAPQAIARRAAPAHADQGESCRRTQMHETAIRGPVSGLSRIISDRWRFNHTGRRQGRAKQA